MGSSYCYEKRVHFRDTDAMRVVHHSVYYNYFEETRVQWMIDRGLSETHYPHADYVLAVLETQCRYVRPLQFGDKIQCFLSGKRKGSKKVLFSYGVYSEATGEKIAYGQTTHAALGEDLKVVDLNLNFINELEKIPWIETWPSNL